MLWTHFHLLISEPSACRLNWENHFKGWITDKCPRSWLLTAHAIYSQCPWFEPFVARHTHFSLSPLVSYQPLCHKLANKGKKAPKKQTKKKKRQWEAVLTVSLSSSYLCIYYGQIHWLHISWGVLLILHSLHDRMIIWCPLQNKY